jgi:hypothetical protein
MRLTVDFDGLCRPREDENCTFSPATLAYETADGEERTLPIEIRVRGGWRAIRENCEVPPLFVVIPSGSADGGLFAGQEVLPLSTHCMSNWSEAGSPQKFMRYVIKEYVGYRLFNLVSDKSLRVRLVNMTYVTPAESQDPDDLQEPIERYAFFTEHFDSLAARHDAEVLTDSSYDPGLPEIVDLNLLALFNYMIGNTDWSITRRHNTILIQAKGGTITPVPFDMDMSGLVNATYAAPAPDAPIRTVRGRWFQGFCRPDTAWEELFAHFQSRQVEMLEIIDEVPGLDRSTRRDTSRFIERFFDILDSPRRRQRSIVNACHPY